MNLVNSRGEMGEEGPLPPWLMNLGMQFFSDARFDSPNLADQALALAKQTLGEVKPARIGVGAREQMLRNAQISKLWLSEASELTRDLPELKLVSREEWLKKTHTAWIEITEPIHEAVGRSLDQSLRSQAPEQMLPLLRHLDGVMRNLCKGIFVNQLGASIGRIAQEILSGQDIGFPLVEKAESSVVLENILGLAQGFEVPLDELEIYLCCRELALARLETGFSWIRHRIMGALGSFARNVEIDHTLLENLQSGFNPENLNSLIDLSGSVRITPSPQQRGILQRLGDSLAIIEGWANVVTASATGRLPHAQAISEILARRSASGGPAEKALATIVGLEVRPQKIRQATSLWQKITLEIGSKARDDLWRHPDLIPSSEALEDPNEFVDNLVRTEKNPGEQAFDRELRQLLDDEASEPDEDN